MTSHNKSSSLTTSTISQFSSRNYELFSLVKLIGVKSSSRDQSKKEEVVIKIVSIGGYFGHSFIALYCSNDNLVLRFVGESEVPIIKYVPWSKELGKKIVALGFNSTAQWLMCVTTDWTIQLIPIYFLMCRNDPEFTQASTPEKPTTETTAGNLFQKTRNFLQLPLKVINRSTSTPTISTSNTTFGSLTEVAILKLNPKSRGIVSCCLWWRATTTGLNYGILGTSNGVLIVINFITNEEKEIRFKSPILNIELVAVSKSYKYLLVNTSSGYWKLLLEHEIDANVFETLAISSSAAFTPEPLSRFQEGEVVTSQQTRQGPLITSYHRAGKLSVYDSEISGNFPIFVYGLFSDVSQIGYSEKFTFVARKNSEEGCTLSVVANLIAATSQGPQKAKLSVMQEFMVYEEIRGLHPSFRDANADRSTLDGCMIWTNTAFYELRPKVPPESIFYQLLGQGLKSAAEPFGMAVGLNLLLLYETAADQLFQMGKYGQALDLYFSSNVDVDKLVARYIQVGRMDVVLNQLRSALHMPTGASEKRRIAGVLLKCYTQAVLNSTEDSRSVEGEFEAFLRTNTDYDVANALALLLQAGTVHYYLLVATVRNVSNSAIKTLLNSGVVGLTEQERRFIEVNKFEGHKIDGVFSQVFSIETQLKLIEKDPYSSATNKFFKRIVLLIPVLNRADLLRICNFFDPSGKRLPELLKKVTRNSSSSPNDYAESAQEASEEPILLSADRRIELFLSALIALLNLESLESQGVVNSTTTSSRVSDYRKSEIRKFDQRTLEETLKAYYKSYRPTLILDRCFDHKNFSAAAIIYSLLDDWTENLRCRLFVIKSRRSTTTQDTSKSVIKSSESLDIVAEALSLFKSLIPRVHKEELVSQMMEFWKDEGLSLLSLEDFLLQNEELSEAICNLIERHWEGNPSSKEWILGFSTEFYFSMMRAFLSKDSFTQEQYVRKLWAGIKDNLEKDLGKRDKVVFASISIKVEANEDIVIFTCGHHFSKRDFYENVLTQFKQYMEELELPLQLTMKLVLSEYNQRSFTLACPHCVFETIEAFQPRTYKRKTWKI